VTFYYLVVEFIDGGNLAAGSRAGAA